MNNVVYVSAHDENGGMYHISLTDDNSGSIETIVNNGASVNNKVHSLTMYSNNVFVFSDTGDSSIKVICQNKHVLLSSAVKRAPKMGVKRSCHRQRASALIMPHCSPWTHQQMPFA